ncbi:uncharacterized protein PAC_06083 [Phialocephala subalpina]|uniref:Uncharacterized protein n=1 Tax=Phialocephala subalpina TaxID=576137 RepID=A0A1L7WTT8_9HELO|nr:uncharacterized protein PAC_06083 [Phialocephala subalpina]
MGKSIKVEIDNFADEDLKKGEFLYANDLSGCTVFCAIWSPSHQTYPSFFAHFGGSTIQDPTAGPELMEKMKEGLDVPTSGYQTAPDKAWLVIAYENGSEMHKVGNERIRSMLRDAGIQKWSEETYVTGSSQRVDQVVELRPGTGDELIKP